MLARRCGLPFTITVFALSCLAAQPARADLASLVGNDPFFNSLEKTAARANQATFNLLDPVCRGGTGANCNGSQLKVYENVRELVHTANELQGSGSTLYSLQLDKQGLGFALRWTAAEETSAEGSSSTDFTNNQLTNLSSRLTALRFGARGFQVTSRGPIPADQMARLARAARDKAATERAAYAVAASGEPSHGDARGRAQNESGVESRAESALEAPLETPLETMTGGGAAADEAPAQFSHLGGFLNISYSLGSSDPTALEDAFDYNSLDLTGGFDYRFDNGWIVGATAGTSHSKVNFDSVKSIVDGDIKGDGGSFAAFAMYNPSAWYATINVSGQFVNFDMTRFIKYPSFNPDVDNVSTATLSNTKSRTLTVNTSGGYDWTWKAFALEPYVKVDYARISIDGFTERDIASDGFDFAVADQTIESLQTGVGVRGSYTWTPSFGVFIPYVRGEYFHEFKDPSRNVKTQYRSIASNTTQASFAVPTNKPDPDYYVATLGLSAIVRGGRPDNDGVIRGGVQVFVEVREILGLQDITNHVFTGGFRYEF